METKVTFKGVEYNIPPTFGKMPAKKAIELYALIDKVQNETMSVNDYNFAYVSTVLGVPLTEVEDCSFEDFMKVLGDINAIMIQTVETSPQSTAI